MGLEIGKYQINVTDKQVKDSARSWGVNKVVFGCAFVGLLAIAVPVNAGIITPATIDPGICASTDSFATYNDCIGQVSDPIVEANGNPSTLVNYLNGDIIDKDGNVGSIGFDPIGFDPSIPWGVQGDWLGISNQLNADVVGELPGTSTDGFFTVTATDRYSGDWTFDLGDLIIDYLVVTVKDGGGWSGYYYDLIGLNQSIFSSTWDTLGITNGNGTAGPEVSHMYAAYIPGGDSPDPDPNPDPNPVPVPGTVVLLGLGLFTMRVLRRARVS